METYYFFKSIRRTIIQFLDMFNNISIERYDINGNVKGKYLVPLRYGPKSKAFLWLKDMARDEEMLPMLSVYMTGIDFDPQRITNKHQDILVSDGNTTTGTYAKNAMPYNIGFTLNIWVAHMVDIDQIYEQILPFFAPYVFIRINVPDVDTTIECKVVLQSCSPEMTDDVSEEEARVVRWSSIFVAQTWLFKPIINPYNGGFLEGTAGDLTGRSGYPLIQKIFTNYYTDEDSFDERDTTSTWTSAAPSGAVEAESLMGIGYDADAAILYEYERFP